MNPQPIQRERHLRALWYLAISLGLGLFANLFLRFDAAQTLGYAVSCFIMLHVVNFRVMFAPYSAPSVERQPSETE